MSWPSGVLGTTPRLAEAVVGEMSARAPRPKKMVERPRPMCRHVDGVSRFAGKEDMVGCVYWLFFYR